MIGVATVTTVAATQFPTMTISNMTLYPAFGLVLAPLFAKLADIDLQQSEYGNQVVSKLFSHRGFTHTGIVVGFLYVVMASLTRIEVSVFASIVESMVLGAVIAYASHIIADMHNKKGAPLLWPLILQKIYFMCILTDDSEGAKKAVTPEKTFTRLYVVLCILQVICYWFNITV